MLGGGGSLSVQLSGCESESALLELSSLTRSNVRSRMIKTLNNSTDHSKNV